MHWLAGLALPRRPALEILPTLLPHLSTLLTARIIKADYQVTAEDLQRLFAGAPASWALPKRASRPVSNVQVTWELPVEQLREAAQRSVAEQETVTVYSPRSTPPLGGVHYKLQIVCKHDDGSCCVGVYACALHLPGDLAMSFGFTVDVRAAGTRILRTGQSQGLEDLSRGWAAFFGVAAMAGGWDERAWAAKGLPTSGTPTVKLTVGR